MKIVLISGARHKTHIKYVSEHTLVNAKVSLTVDSLKDYLQHYGAMIDAVIITDGGLLCSPADNIRIIQELADEAVLKNIFFAALTHDFYLKNELSRFEDVNATLTDFLRVTETEFAAALKSAAETERKAAVKPPENNYSSVPASVPIYEKEDEKSENSEDNKTKSKRKPFGIGGSKKKPKTENDDFSNISRAQSRAIAFTGRAGAGVTSSLINIAHSAAKKGLRTIILDLDTEYRASNLYINKFCTMAEESEDVCRSLIKTLANPQNYQETAVSVNENLWVTALGYDFNDKQALDNFFTEQKIIALVSALKNKFDYVFIDISLRVLARIAGVMMHFDTFALCVENNIYAAVTTLRALINDFTPENIQYLNLKSKLVATKYNDESMYDDEILTPDGLAELMTDNMCEDFIAELQVAGAVPYALNFDRQIEHDIPVYETNTLLAESYDKILSGL